MYTFYSQSFSRPNELHDYGYMRIHTHTFIYTTLTNLQSSNSQAKQNACEGVQGRIHVESCMYVFMYECVCICLYLSMHVFVRTRMHVDVCVQTGLCADVWVYYTCLNVRACARTKMCSERCIQLYVCLCMHVSVLVYM